MLIAFENRHLYQNSVSNLACRSSQQAMAEVAVAQMFFFGIYMLMCVRDGVNYDSMINLSYYPIQLETETDNTSQLKDPVDPGRSAW